MKKTFLALAVLGAFAGVASAQSSVTLYGRLDGGIGAIDPKAGRTSDVSSTTGVFTGIQAGNRFGIRGSETLGGGLRAIFALENGFSLDDGQQGQGGRLFGRQAYAGLASSGFGTVVLGRLATFSSGTGDFDRFGSLDPFRTGAGLFGFQATMASANALRLDNAVAYVSPNFAGFSAGLGYTFRAAGQETPGSGSNNRGYISYANYSAGPLYAVITYDAFELGQIAGKPKQEHLQIGASWDFKIVKLSAAYASEKDQYALGPAGVSFLPSGIVTGASVAPALSTLQGNSSDADAWALGAIVPFGPHRINASYQSRSVDSTATSGDAERTAWALGYEYSLSRRTNVYVYYGDVKDEDAYKVANWGGISGYYFGLNHSF